MPDRLMTSNQVASWLTEHNRPCCARTVRRQMAAGDLPGRLIAKTYLTTESALVAWFGIVEAEEAIAPAIPNVTQFVARREKAS